MAQQERYKKKVYCRRCKIQTNHTIIYKHSIDGEEDDGGFSWSEDYLISQCMGCDTIGFIRDYDDSTMHFFVYDDESGKYETIDIEDIVVYPPEPINNKANINSYSIVEFQHLPELLDILYKQVVANFELKHYLLAAAGLRMIIEGICNDLAINKGYLIDDATGEIKLDENGNKVRSSNLNGRINGFVEKGILTEGQTAILHIIRKLGNQSVHKLNNPNRRIIISALEIIEHTFRNIYELKKYDKLATQFK